MNLPPQRIRAINNRPLNPDGRYVLYWMLAARRTGWNFALQHAVTMANTLQRPLLVFEHLSCDYPFASDRLHRFLLQGMADNLRALAPTAASYYPYLEPAPGAGRGLLTALSVQAALVVTDDTPLFYLPRLVQAAGDHLPMRLEAIDGNGLLPMRLADHAYPTAYAFRRFLQKTLPAHLMEWPAPAPLAQLAPTESVRLPTSILEQWPSAEGLLRRPGEVPLDALPIDHDVAPATLCGGERAADQRLQHFVADQLDRYAAERNHPDLEVTSGLSPYLHFGHISSHAVFAAITAAEHWTPDRLALRSDGRRSGWWQMSENAEAFLDQLITWRELGYNMSGCEPDRYRHYDSLPDWARKTLAAHRYDSRPYCYTLEDFERAQTHDPLWNAAQNQLRRDGVMHNYLRMLWGKKILEWSASPEQALEIMITLNDRYALDGRDPNSYSGIFWCLGRYDRAWGPEREIFGTVRYMSSANTARKVRLKDYLQKYSAR